MPQTNELQSTPNSLLLDASDKGNLIAAIRAVNAGADVNVKSSEGVTPLFMAIGNNHTVIVTYLLTTGVNLEEKNGEFGSTSLFIACFVGSLKIVKFLVNAGANVNTKTTTNNTPLYAAIGNNRKNIVDYLLTKGVNLEEKNGESGSTALYVACYMGFLEIVKSLVDAGANPDAINDQGYTPIEIAIDRNHQPIVEYLQSLKNPAPAPAPAPLWKGFTQSDISKFDTIFDESQVSNIAVCPVCLKYVERSEACMYMNHNCAAQGGYYHHELYEKYKDAGGKIHWCTICGRICIGHNHYNIGLAKDSKPDAIVTYHDPFSKDCRDANGGGGLPEKFGRFQRMREIALQLQDYIGQMIEREALNTLVEETWNAPLHKNLRIPKIMTERKWNFPATEFPANVVTTINAVTVNYNNPSAYQQPIVRAPGSNNYAGNMITLDDSEPTIQFKHKNAVGTMNDAHGQITVTSLIHYIDNAGENKGKCFDDTCGGFLWPQEIALAFADPLIAATITDAQKDRLTAYKVRFNGWHAEGAVGGAKARMRRTQRRRRLSTMRMKDERKGQ